MWWWNSSPLGQAIGVRKESVRPSLSLLVYHTVWTTPPGTPITAAPAPLPCKLLWLIIVYCRPTCNESMKHGHDIRMVLISEYSRWRVSGKDREREIERESCMPTIGVVCAEDDAVAQIAVDDVAHDDVVLGCRVGDLAVGQENADAVEGDRVPDQFAVRAAVLENTFRKKRENENIRMRGG